MDNLVKLFLNDAPDVVRWRDEVAKQIIKCITNDAVITSSPQNILSVIHKTINSCTVIAFIYKVPFNMVSILWTLACWSMSQPSGGYDTPETYAPFPYIRWWSNITHTDALISLGWWCECVSAENLSVEQREKFDYRTCNINCANINLNDSRNSDTTDKTYLYNSTKTPWEGVWSSTINTLSFTLMFVSQPYPGWST